MPATQTVSSNFKIHTELNSLLRSRHWARGLKLFSRKAARGLSLGNTKSRFRGRGMEFEEVRRYQPGDDIRSIDWKVSARVGDTYTKLFCEERERPCHILVDQRSALFFGSSRQFKSVLAAELATAIAWAALAGGDRVGGQVIGDYEERDSRGRRSKQAVLKLIHDVHQANQRLGSDLHLKPAAPEVLSLANSLQECRRITRPGTAIFVISDFHDFDADCAKALSKLGRHADLSMFQIYDSLEEQLHIGGNIAISNGEQSTNVELSKKLKSEYRKTLATHQEVLLSAVAQARAMFTKVDTSQPARDVLYKIFAN